MVCNQAGQIGNDTLAVLKDVYLNYRTARDPDGLSEDIVLAIAPGVMQDKPTNEYLDAAWKSLKALGNKHVGPKIGQIVQNKQSLLQHVYTRGVWSRTPDHNLVFTYQTMPRNATGRKRMQYLSEPGGVFGDTAFNSWPVPMVPLANMAKTTMQVHDDIFAGEAAEDSGTEDGAGSAVVQDLGDKVIPFPREMSEMLTREMLHVFEIDVAVFLTPASGKALMAVILENRRAVGIVKNKDQRDFIMQQLTEGVKTLNLAANRRPAKPQELTDWESSPGAKAAGAPPPVLGVAGGVAGGAAGGGGAGAAAAGGAPSLRPPVLPPPTVAGPGVASPAAASMGPPPPPSAANPGAAGSAAATPGLAAFGAAVLR